MQLNSSYYSACGGCDKSYLLARAIQFFAPGIPLVYYVGLLAGENDIELVESSKNGRDLNRHAFGSVEAAAKEMERPVVKVRPASVIDVQIALWLQVLYHGSCLRVNCRALYRLYDGLSFTQHVGFATSCPNSSCLTLTASTAHASLLNLSSVTKHALI